MKVFSVCLENVPRLKVKWVLFFFFSCFSCSSLRMPETCMLVCVWVCVIRCCFGFSGVSLHFSPEADNVLVLAACFVSPSYLGSTLHVLRTLGPGRTLHCLSCSLSPYPTATLFYSWWWENEEDTNSFLILWEGPSLTSLSPSFPSLWAFWNVWEMRNRQIRLKHSFLHNIHNHHW